MFRGICTSRRTASEINTEIRTICMDQKTHRRISEMKNHAHHHPVIAHPRLDLPYKLYTDACNYAIGAILCQIHEDGVERVVQYFLI